MTKKSIKFSHFRKWNQWTFQWIFPDKRLKRFIEYQLIDSSTTLFSSVCHEENYLLLFAKIHIWCYMYSNLIFMFSKHNSFNYFKVWGFSSVRLPGVTKHQKSQDACSGRSQLACCKKKKNHTFLFELDLWYFPIPLSKPGRLAGPALPYPSLPNKSHIRSVLIHSWNRSG